MHRELSNESSVRGRKLRSAQSVRRNFEQQRRTLDGGVIWGQEKVSREDVTSHFCVVGAVGSGKTLTIRMLMRNQLPLIRKKSDARALIYDPKQDMVPIVGSILADTNPDALVILLNPFDQRASAWNIALDIDSPAAARQLAETLVPAFDSESQPFFTNAVRELLTAVVTVFTRTRYGKWTFRELLLVMRSTELLHAVLDPHPYSRPIAKNFLNVGEITLSSIMATIATKLGPYEPIAAAWEKLSQRKVSIKQWLTSDAILILGNDERVRAVLDSVNRLFVAIVAQQVLALPESRTRRTWFYFDEFSEAGKLPGLESIILRGRSKGCCVVLGFQDISHVYEVYGEHLGNTLVGQCGNKALLRIESPVTAEWASKSVGDLETIETNRSKTRDASGSTSQTYAEQRQLRATVLPSQFMEIPVTGPDNGLGGYYLLRAKGAHQATYTWPEVIEMIGPPSDHHKPYVAAPVEWQYLDVWTDDDAKRLGIANVQSRATKSAESNTLDGFGRVQI